MKKLDEAARELAAKGEAMIGRVAAIAERARGLLESGDMQPTSAPERAPFAWEAAEDFPIGARSQIYLATIEYFGTGEGLTVSFFAGLAPSENAFRKSISRQLGVHFADCAVIGQGSAADVPFGEMFLSSALSARLEQIERSDDRPGAFSFFARWHANYS